MRVKPVRVKSAMMYIVVNDQTTSYSVYREYYSILIDFLI